MSDLWFWQDLAKIVNRTGKDVCMNGWVYGDGDFVEICRTSLDIFYMIRRMSTNESGEKTYEILAKFHEHEVMGTRNWHLTNNGLLPGKGPKKVRLDTYATL